ncbi:MAG: UDP-N-acetylmuramate--L-alanine ligase [Anaerolineae bacterium]
MIDLQQVREVHIVGIGGAGMSAIARVLQGKGIRVHGSDQRHSPLTDALTAEGIPVAIGHAAGNLGRADLVLISSAVREDNVEVQAAKQQGLQVLDRPQFLGALTAGYDVIAIAGAHGKTTVTGMTTLLLLEAGLDPTYIVGGVMADLGTNGHAGTGKHFVIEADEYRNTFLALKPAIAVVTNVEFDHPDSFPSERFVRMAFGNFVDNIRPGGMLIACNDDRLAHAIAASYHANGGNLMLYGQNEGVGLTWRALNIRANERGGVSFTAKLGAEVVGDIHLRVPGDYNAVNALAVLGVAQVLKIKWAVARAALERFSGTARRFEMLGDVDDIVVIDDYAHHPTQIRNVLRAARQRYPGRRIVAVWEPHTFSRVKALHAEFMTAFADADRVFVLPIYAAREVDDGTLTADILAQQIKHPSVGACVTLEEAIYRLTEQAQPGDVILMLGAGNEYIVGKRLVLELERTS